MSEAEEDQSLDRLAALSITEMIDKAGDLSSIAAPAGLEAATLLGYGWWVRVLRTADAVRLLHGHEYSHEASPLVRTALHHAAALEWLRLEPAEVVSAVNYEHQVRRQKLYQKAEGRQWNLKEIRMGPPYTAPRPPSVDLLHRFEKLAAAINTPNMYVAYMIESAYAHPSGIGSEAYVDDHEDAVALRTTPKEPGVPLRQVAVFAAIATRSFGSMTDMPLLVDLADEVGTRLGVDATLS